MRASISRRRFLELTSAGGIFALLGGWLALAKSTALAAAANIRTALVRPPGARDEEDFLSRCIGCRQCSDVCPNDCIRFTERSTGRGTPYVRPREQACILCMRCTQVCPTGALKRVDSDSAEDILANVQMGTAVIDKNICNSYQNYACGACVQACPFKGSALKALTWERPVVDESVCVGCGLCEKTCIVYPQAIRVVPRSVES